LDLDAISNEDECFYDKEPQFCTQAAPWSKNLQTQWTITKKQVVVVLVYTVVWEGNTMGKFTLLAETAIQLIKTVMTMG
jgi:hypothetical protein